MRSLLEAVLGNEEADRAFERFCRSELGSGIGEVLFERASTGIVRGLELEDGRRVVVKAHQPAQDRIFLAAVRDVQAFLHAAGYTVPLPLAGPAPLGLGFALAQELRDEGTWEDAHRPEIRCELARSLARQLVLTRGSRSRVGAPSRLATLGGHGALAAGGAQPDLRLRRDSRRCGANRRVGGARKGGSSAAASPLPVIPTGVRSTCASSAAPSPSSTTGTA